jgi:4,5-dihydroxyphthalate decarboxylase
MMAELSTALGTYSHVAALRDGTVTPVGHELTFVELNGPIISAFRRMVRGLEFDVCEMAITTYLSAKEYKKPFTAIPIFPARAFPHRAILVNKNAGISSPKDLEGKRVGVRAYTVTTGVWARAVLAETYGVDLDSVTWVISDEEHVQECVLPSNVEYLPGADLGAMLESGELVAGIGIYQGKSDDIEPLIKDRAAVEKALVDTTGIYPINHTIVIKDSLLAEDDGLAASLYTAFVEAKKPFSARIEAGVDLTDEETELANRRAIVGPDPLPYGIESNRPTLEAIIRQAHAQKILSRAIDVEEMFVPGAEG